MRELENSIEYAVVLGSTQDIMSEDLPERVMESADVDLKTGPHLKYHDAVREAKKQIVLNALQQANGDYSEAANALNIHVNNLHRFIRELNLKTRVQSGKGT